MIRRPIATVLVLLAMESSAGESLPREDAFGDWSPDGERIVFVSTRSGARKIWTMNADGTDPRQVTDGPGEDISPSWAPGGDTIAFVSNRDGNMELYLVSPRGGELLRISDTPGNEAAPDWSADGKRLVFAYSDDPDPSTIGRTARAFVCDTEGRSRTALFDDGVQVYPRWSPDGARLTYSGIDSPEATYGVFVASADGTAPRRVSGEAVAFNSDWMPDGKNLVFVSPQDGVARLYLVKLDGRTPERFSDNETGWFQPRVSPDGHDLLVRVGFGAEHRGLAIVSIDGEPIRLLAGPDIP